MDSAILPVWLNERVNLRIDNYGIARFSMERSGHTSGFQRMSYKVGLDGTKISVVQTAFDANLKLARQKSETTKNVLFDVKKKPVRRK